MPDPQPPQDKQYTILIGTPVPTGMCHAAYTQSLVKTLSLFTKAPNIRLYHKFVLNDNLVSRSRNLLAAYILSEPRITHLLFIDPDIRWDPKQIYKLITNNKPICAAVYSKRGYRWDRLRTKKFHELLTKKDLSDAVFREKAKAILLDYNVHFGATRKMEDGVIEVEEIGAGFMLIAREVFDTMAQAHPEWKLKDPKITIESKAKDFVYSFFEYGMYDGNYYSEDYSFCKKWRSLGGQIYADLSINLSHFGIEEYHGNILLASKIIK